MSLFGGNHNVDFNRLDGQQQHIYNTAWNAAIEAAAKVAIKERHNQEMESEIRKLKK